MSHLTATRIFSFHDNRDLLRRPDFFQSFCDIVGGSSEGRFLFKGKVAGEGDFAARGDFGAPRGRRTMAVVKEKERGEIPR